MKLFLGKLAVVFKRDLLVALRLRGGLASLVTLLFDVAGLYYLTRSIGPLYRPDRNRDLFVRRLNSRSRRRRQHLRR